MKLKCRRRRVGDKGLGERVCKGARMRGRNVDRAPSINDVGGIPPLIPPRFNFLCPAVVTKYYVLITVLMLVSMY